MAQHNNTNYMSHKLSGLFLMLLMCMSLNPMAAHATPKITNLENRATISRTQLIEFTKGSTNVTKWVRPTLNDEIALLA